MPQMRQNLMMKDLIQLGHIEATAGLIHCPTLRSLGLANIADIKTDETPVMGAYGKMEEVSTGKDTTSGHWE